MKPWIRVAEIRFFPQPNAAGAEGAVYYQVGGDVPKGACTWMRQPFRRGESVGNEENGGLGIIWGWDGNRDAPTLTPSFFAEDGVVRVHLFLRAGKIELCADSTVEVKAE